MQHMAKKGKTPVSTQTVKRQAAESSAKTHASRSGVSKTFWIDDDLDAALNRYLKSQKVKQQQTAVFNAALEAFLAAAGFWPPKETK